LHGHQGVVAGAAFSSDGRLAVTASFDKSARIWNARTGDENAVLRGHRKAVTAAVFSTDGHRIVTASDDASGQVWATFESTQALVDFARSILPRELTPEERKAFFLDPAAAVQPGR
jgi:WD40 repeat protein